jgi:hypothetical protein
MFAVPISTEGDKHALQQLKGVYGGGVAKAFRECSDLASARSQDLGKFAGKQQDITRIVTRMTAAMNQISAATDEVARFCSDEMPETIDRLLADTTEAS